MKIAWNIALSLATALLPACGGDGDGGGSPDSNMAGVDSGQAACESITGGTSALTTTVDAGCADCSITESAAAADGNLGSYATARVNQAAPGQGVSVRATAQSGIVFPAGQTAGAFVSVPAGDGQSYSVTIRTLLSGVVQESVGSDNSGGGCGVCGGHGSKFDGFVTTKQFDAVEVFINNNQASGTPTFGIYEICSNHQ